MRMEKMKVRNLDQYFNKLAAQSLSQEGSQIMVMGTSKSKLCGEGSIETIKGSIVLTLNDERGSATKRLQANSTAVEDEDQATAGRATFLNFDAGRTHRPIKTSLFAFTGCPKREGDDEMDDAHDLSIYIGALSPMRKATKDMHL
eukprot:TRINITY_DN13188_c0_g1_i2.p1 TRINITY_DN13188_c0_g1~~TRINITY_DN13188_c0_g1_i2.p1  ORF type:complete len:145 (-),score=30.55 TRINITY_DN13188_c0_g1_i2:119-553(-)